MISNAFKHAFPHNQTGDVWVTLAAEDKTFSLKIKDNGVGFPAGLNFQQSPSLGLQLVNDLTRQLQGQITLEATADDVQGRPGTSLKIVFRELYYRKRL